MLLPGVFNKPGNMRILRSNPIYCINNQEDNICPFNRLHRAHYAVLLNPRLNPSTPTYSRSINQDNGNIFEIQTGVHGVPHVVPGIGLTIDLSIPNNMFKRLDLPAFGLPAIPDLNVRFFLFRLGGQTSYEII